MAVTVAVGTKLGRYEIVKHLTSGGMADLLLARADGLEGFERHVVIKRIRVENEDDPGFIEMFLHEARLAGSLHHHNIVQVYDVGEQDGRPYFAMEYVHGEDLRTVLRRLFERKEQLPVQHLITIMAAVATALHHAHEQKGPDRKPLGIVHRDVTPANILVGYDGNVKVVDFGIARVTARMTETQTSMLAGKAPYMAPEQCTGGTIDRRCDVFSVGTVLFELATVRRLFKGDNEFVTMSAVVKGTVPKPSAFRADLPPELDEIILRALAKDPAARYQNAEQLFTALETVAITHGLRTSSTSLATYMKQLFGERPEPWIGEYTAPVTTVDFDGLGLGVVKLSPVTAAPAPVRPTREVEAEEDSATSVVTSVKDVADLVDGPTFASPARAIGAARKASTPASGTKAPELPAPRLTPLPATPSIPAIKPALDSKLPDGKVPAAVARIALTKVAKDAESKPPSVAPVVKTATPAPVAPRVEDDDEDLDEDWTEVAPAEIVAHAVAATPISARAVAVPVRAEPKKEEPLVEESVTATTFEVETTLTPELAESTLAGAALEESTFRPVASESELSPSELAEPTFAAPVYVPPARAPAAPKPRDALTQPRGTPARPTPVVSKPLAIAAPAAAPAVSKGLSWSNVMPVAESAQVDADGVEMLSPDDRDAGTALANPPPPPAGPLEIAPSSRARGMDPTAIVTPLPLPGAMDDVSTRGTHARVVLAEGTNVSIAAPARTRRWMVLGGAAGVALLGILVAVVLGRSGDQPTVADEGPATVTASEVAAARNEVPREPRTWATTEKAAATADPAEIVDAPAATAEPQLAIDMPPTATTENAMPEVPPVVKKPVVKKPVVKKPVVKKVAAKAKAKPKKKAAPKPKAVAKPTSKPATKFGWDSNPLFRQKK